MPEFDRVIVGAGSAGCVPTNRVSSDPVVIVCVLEASAFDRFEFISTCKVGTEDMAVVDPSRAHTGWRTCAWRGRTG
jgi:choline dehydrogenase-like flavoprotein